MSMLFGTAADLLVSVLLVATIVTSFRLSGRIAGMKAQEATMRATVSDLGQATDKAERAIAALRTTLSDCDRTLIERIRAAEHHAAALAERVAAGEVVISRVEQIVDISRKIAGVGAAPAPPPAPAGPADVLRAAALSAQAVAERAARRLESRAA